ncbi:hypothetical protein [Streptomyces scopuliridis]|uniref:Lipopolysaccharide assembly protein A domain-containing protein n=1 Tax=Streptomyces scopuliridis RB72 TaxID=1440053 RepID=A0A2T7T203_9ACTN|nr:hypothetical protein [Streptomyces scopuliridis]PVE09169.1 hypothetical protein Y717_03140 [Streptomyces scopuliridis RB72]
MLIIGILLMAAAAAFTALLIVFNLSGGPDYVVSLFGSHPFTINALGAFLSGIALTLIFGLGLWLALGAAALMARRSRKRRAARDAVAEREELRGRLDETRADSDRASSAARGTTEASRRPAHRFHLPRHGH